MTTMESQIQTRNSSCCGPTCCTPGTAAKAETGKRFAGQAPAPEAGPGGAPAPDTASGQAPAPEAASADHDAPVESPDAATLRQAVRTYYAQRAVEGSSCCGPTGASSDRISGALGYSAEELSAVPDGANLGLGCGNPTAIDTISAGAVVLDLGSGGGFDCFLAAKQVGPTGRVIGVDMTPEMVERARANAAAAGIDNVEFRLGEIEALPVADSSVDVIISNCVINLSTDKPRVFADAYRVLRPGGRLMVSDLVLTRELPPYIQQSLEAYAGCLSGAEQKDRYLSMMTEVGFADVRVTGESNYLAAIADVSAADCLPESIRGAASDLLGGISPVASLQVLAKKPAAAL